MEVWWDPNRRNQHVKSASIKWNWNKILDLKGLIEILHGGQSFPKVGVKETGAYFFPQSEASVDLTSFSNYLVALASFNGGAEECESGKGIMDDPIKVLLCIPKYSGNDEDRVQPIKEITSYLRFYKNPCDDGCEDFNRCKRSKISSSNVNLREDQYGGQKGKFMIVCPRIEYIYWDN